MDGREKTREPRSAESFHRKPRLRRSRSVQQDRKKDSRQRLKLMDPPPQNISIRFEKNVMAARSNGPYKVRNPWMIQRLASTNPNDRRRTGNGVTNLFVRNRMIRTRMQDFSGISKRQQPSLLCRPQYSLNSGSR
jgi:hypothetical protein